MGFSFTSFLLVRCREGAKSSPRFREATVYLAASL